MKLTAARLVLAPLLIVQGRRVRRVALKLPEPAGPREGLAGPDAAQAEPLRLLIVGDSAIAGVGAAHQHDALAGRLAAGLARRLAGDGRQVHWRLVARSGATTADALALLDEEAARAQFGAMGADVAVVGLGVNDVTGQVPPGRWLRTLDALALRLQERHGARRVVFSGLPPMHLFPLLPQPLRWYLGTSAQRYDRALQDWVRGRAGFAYAPLPTMVDPAMMAEDGFHPGPPAYAVWGEALAQAVASALAPGSADLR